MKTEKVVLSFIAVVIGILAAGIAFYLYQTTKIVPSQKTLITLSPTPRQQKESSSKLFLTIDTPKDEDVVGKKTITISGKTNADAIVVISTAVDDHVINPAANGSFSSSATIGNGQNTIQITAISPKGQEIKTLKTITYSTESF